MDKRGAKAEPLSAPAEVFLSEGFKARKWSKIFLCAIIAAVVILAAMILHGIAVAHPGIPM